MLDIPCVIFAGGQSRRMGEDKALLPFGGFKTLTQFQLDKLSPHFTDVYISCKDKNKFDFKADFIEDNPLYQNSSPLIALVSVFEYLRCDKIAVLSVDTPFFTHTHFKKLLAHGDNQSAITVAKSSSGTQPLCAIYTKEALPFMRTLITEKRYKMRELFEKAETVFVDFNDEEIFSNLNFQEDYQKALQRNNNG